MAEEHEQDQSQVAPEEVSQAPVTGGQQPQTEVDRGEQEPPSEQPPADAPAGSQDNTSEQL